MTKTIQHSLKTAIAATLTWWLYGVLPMPDATRPLWAVVTTVLVMQSNLGGVLRASGVRVLGTAMGAIVGATFAMLFGSELWALAGAIFVTMGLLTGMGLPETLRLAGVTSAVVIVGLPHGAGPFNVGALRFLDVVLGISVAIVVQTFVWPSRANNQLYDAVLEVVKSARELYPISVELKESPCTPAEIEQRDELRAKLILAMATMRELFGDVNREPGDHRQEIATWTSYIRLCEELEHHTLAVEHLQRGMYDVSFAHHLADPMHSLVTLTVQGLDRIIERLESKATNKELVSTGLDASISGADAALTRLREQGLTLSFGIPEVVRFCTFFFNLRAVGRHVGGLDTLLSTKR